MIKLTIDGLPIETHPGTSILEAALAEGIDIPRLCYHPDLTLACGCRLCLVEIEGWDKPTTSCGLACSEGMVVNTQSEAVREVSRMWQGVHRL